MRYSLYLSLVAVLAFPQMRSRNTATLSMPGTASTVRHETMFCTTRPGSTMAVIRVERDTTLLFQPASVQHMSSSGVRPGPMDSLLATPSTQMPAARVRVLKLDSATSAVFVANGVPAKDPVAYIRAAPYRADCQTVAWTDTASFAARGDVSYVRATLAPMDQWISGAPVLVIAEVGNYPYPRRRGLAFGIGDRVPLAPADAIFSLSSELDPPQNDMLAKPIADTTRRTRAIAWARANPRDANLEPARTMLRRAVLDPDWAVARQMPSRLRGTYRVSVETGGERSTWFFRTHDRPGYVWNAGDSLQSTTMMLASPHILGYSIVGYAGSSVDSISNTLGSGPLRTPLVWLYTADRPTVADNDSRSTLPGILEFMIGSAPEKLWNDLEAFVPPSSARDSAFAAQFNIVRPRRQKQARIPLTIQLNAGGVVRGDTILDARGRMVRIAIERIDTASIKRPF